ncbi:hypothetical protein MR532_00130 [bacterium]|nr:hypothetical protein [bacterium]
MDQRVMDMVVRVETYTRQLLMRQQQMRDDYARLQERLREREEEILSVQIKLEELQKKYDHLRMAKFIDMADDDTKDIRGRIRKMVRDIDRCISMLKIDH